MINVGILGADSRDAGELLRLLILHPEIEIRSIVAPALRGQKISSYHRGLIGDTELRFSDIIDSENIDILFITSPNYTIPHDFNLPERVKVIALKDRSDYIKQPFDKIEYVQAVSEMFRKPLVRGARGAVVTSPSEAVIIIALFPLALHLMLNNDVSVKISLPSQDEEKKSIDELKKEVEDNLNRVQLSFTSIRNIEVETSNSVRAISVEISLPCLVALEEVERIYQDTYADHNFTFLVGKVPEPNEVSGTQKCLIYLSKPEEGMLRIFATADGLMRGGAGDAIHALNLLFGLFEKIGLTHPASLAFLVHGE